MDRAIYEVSVEGIRQIEFDEFHKQDLNESSAYLYDIKVSHREEAVEEFLESKSILSDYSRALEKIHFSLSFPPVKSILDQESAYRIYFQELIKTTDVLKDSLREMGQRLDALHDHYHLMLQDKSNKRLNFLTIIQSIFVPITLLTGLYGMNFVFMPELEFKYGYFIVLGMILIIVSGFLRYFYKHGWFD